jgi:hypothetical protein
MKTTLFIFASVVFVTIAGCKHKQERYLDLTSNEYVNLKQDSKSGAMVNAETGKPVTLYVDTKTDDTIYVFDGEKEVVNGRIRQSRDGVWMVKVDGEEYKAISEHGAKIKMEGEEYKYKSADGAKEKIEGDEYKYKNGNYTYKREGDGDVKIENGRTQTKIDGETGEVKTKKDKNITDKVKNVFKDND